MHDVVQYFINTRLPLLPFVAQMQVTFFSSSKGGDRAIYKIKAFGGIWERRLALSWVWATWKSFPIDIWGL